MKIAAFYSDSPFAGWVQAEGFCDVLSRMGHDVVRIGVPPVSQVTREIADRVNKPIDDCELVIVSGAEHLLKWITAFYKDWSKLKVPRVAWYHESFVREDYTIDYSKLDPMFDHHFFPDEKDAAKYGGTLLPLGCDASMFNTDGQGSHQHPMANVRDIDAGFIGLMYPKRARFVEELEKCIDPLIKIKYHTACRSENGLVPAVAVYDLDGLNVRASAQLLARAYRRIKVLVTFPSLSSVLVAKVLESLACGCTLVAPKQPVDLKSYYRYETPQDCADAVKLALAKPLSGVEEVFENHRMEQRFETIFQKVGIECLTPR